VDLPDIAEWGAVTVPLPGDPPEGGPTGGAEQLHGDRRLSSMWQLLQSPAVAALSLDIFDTLLWRTVPEPAQAFVLLGTRLRDRGLLPTDLSPSAFGRLRHEAERRARDATMRTRGSPECRLEEIWAEMGSVATLGPLPRYIDEEVELEGDVCRVDLGVARLAALTVRVLGKGVRLVSDTYFSTAHVRRLLSRPELDGIVFTDIAASCEYGVNKSTGLFDASLMASGLDPSQVVHLGDNEHADVEGATSAGVLAVHYQKADHGLMDILRAEAVIGVPLGDGQAIDPSTGDSGLTSLRAKVLGLSDRDEQLPSLRPFWSAGATVFGPALTGFASWVHERAAAHGAQKVLCLMREGEFLDRLVQRAASGAETSVPSEPLWLSRQVCALASVTAGTRTELQTFLVRRRPSSVAGLLAHLGVDAGLLPVLDGLLAAPLDAPHVADRVLDALEDAPQARAQLVLTARRLRGLLLEYLEGQLPPSGPVVIVDVGWGGTIQALLSALLKERGDAREVVGLYLMTQAVGEARRLDGLLLEGFLASGGEPEHLMGPLLRTPEILEQVTMCDEGTLIGFHEDGRPLTADARMPRWQVSQREAVQAGVRAFQDVWLANRAQSPAALRLDGAHARGLMLRQLSRLVTRPTADEALAFGSWLHDDNFGDDANAAIIDPRTLDRARYSSPAGLARLSMRDGYWPVGAARLVDGSLAALTGLVAEARIDAASASVLSELGEVSVYVDEGKDFLDGAKDVVRPWAGPQGRVLVHSDQPVERAERVRVDFSARHGLIRLDRFTISVATSSAREPYVVSLVEEALAGSATFLHDARWLQPGVFEITGPDPFYAVDLRELLPPAIARAYLVDVEMTLAAIHLPRGVLHVPPPPPERVEVVVEVPVEVPVPVRPAWERVARRATRRARAPR